MYTPRSGHLGRKLAAVLGLACAGVLIGGVSSASALFTQCPPIGADTGCGTLITVNADGTGSVDSDATQPPYENIEDTLVGIQNNSTGTVNSVDLSSTANIFGFDGDGLCTVSPAPAGCPFGTTGYEGPITTFSNISPDTTAGTVNFTSGGVGPGGSAYWSLEEAISAADIHLGTLNVTPAAAVAGAACSSVDANAVGYKPKKKLTPTVPGVRAYVTTSEPSQVTAVAKLSFSGASAARDVSLGTFTLQVQSRKKLRIPIPASLLNVLSIGDRVTLSLALTTTSNKCASKSAKNVDLKTRVVHILKSEHN